MNRTRYVVLAEDLRQVGFVRHILLEQGVDRRKIRVNMSPQGKGAGEQFVAKAYPVEVRLYRSRANHLNVALVVATDADTLTVQQRAMRLEKKLADAHESSRDPKERIPLLIPKRNTETWCYCLQGNTVNEVTDYKQQVAKGSCKPEAQKFLDLCRKGFAADAPPSMVQAREELKRIGI